MRWIERVEVMQRQALRWRRLGVRVGLVPTMGYLHEGHLSLVSRARAEVGRRGRVVVSVYVNPTQFAVHEDMGRYPRDLRRDRRMCREAGVDVVFVPSDAGMYGRGGLAPSSTFVVEEVLARGMEGASRPEHFRGVTTVVAKLLNLVQPDVAVFGEKDFQQASVVGRMMRDLFVPARLVVAPTVREGDGLAMSSRNAYLGKEERRQATVLYRVLQEARRRVREAGKGGIAVGRLRSELRRMIEGCPLARLDYLAFYDPRTLRPVTVVARGVHMAMAVWIGGTRLIDNARL